MGCCLQLSDGLLRVAVNKMIPIPFRVKSKSKYSFIQISDLHYDPHYSPFSPKNPTNEYCHVTASSEKSTTSDEEKKRFTTTLTTRNNENKITKKVPLVKLKYKNSYTKETLKNSDTKETLDTTHQQITQTLDITQQITLVKKSKKPKSNFEFGKPGSDCDSPMSLLQETMQFIHSDIDPDIVLWTGTFDYVV